MSLSSKIPYLLLLILLTSFSLPIPSCHGARTFTFQMHHGFSTPVRKWIRSRSHHFPLKGTIDYYSALADRDQLLLLRRRLSSINNGSVTFANGNSTLRLSSLGFLHYTTVSIGTPSKQFLVALDTGSDLFWVPCDCTSCAPTLTSSYGSDYEAELNVYHPRGSSTSKRIMCNNSLCGQRNRCLGTFSNCPYTVSYISSDTSTSGILVEDVLHLITEDSPSEVDAWITFGCGQVQTGSFLEFAAPNGLFGLGMKRISVPSILSRAGLTADSFSMCFGRDGVGRISFGDKGSPQQDETPFIIDSLHPTYNISVTQIRVGKNLIDTHFDAVFDSGTSFTYMTDPAYTQLSESFNLQHSHDTQLPYDSRIPFENCYKMSSDADSSLIPSISLMMKGGSQYPVYDPLIVISSGNELVYCLAVVKSTNISIIGQNFMTGYKVVFDREKSVLGWEKFDCYNIERPANSTEVVADGPETDNYTPEAQKESESNLQFVMPEASSSSAHWIYRFWIALYMYMHILFWR
ncbi:hypothetical protein ACHQM5_016587 [Ranunculus cassubicifolius]